MYLSHYNLAEKPFQITTDPKFIWLGEKHQEALSILKYGILESKGFLLLTGEVGTGKTVLINCLTTMVDLETIVTAIPDPDLEIIDFFNFLSSGFQLNKNFESKGAFLIALKDFLHKSDAENRKVLLIIDEAQRLNSKLLEEIRLLSNIELHDRKLINIFFVGQKEFHGTLLEDRNKAVAQRISVRYNIEPLTETETGEYIRHRLKVAGTEKKIFNAGALHEIYTFSAGVPRLVNIICDHALLTGYAAGKKVIDARIIKECAEELRIPVQESTEDARLQETLESIRHEIAEGIRLSRFEKHEPDTEAPPEKPVRKSVDRRDGAESKTPAGGKPPVDPLVAVETGKSGPAVKRPLWIKAFYICIAGALLAFGGYLLQRYEPKGKEAFELEELTPKKYKDSLQKERLHLEAELSGEKPPPQEPSETASASKSGRQTPSYGSGRFGAIKDLIPDGAESEAQSAAPPQAGAYGKPDADPGKDAEALPATSGLPDPKPDKDAESPVETERVGFDSLRKYMTFPGERIVIPFGQDSNDIPTDAFEMLDAVSKFIVQHPETRLNIKGYTDIQGRLGYNMRISEFRANTIKSYLVGKGADPSKIKTFGLGPQNPIATNETPEGREANRRVEIEFETEDVL